MFQLTRPPERALIMHFTHISNMPMILSTGQLVADNSVSDRLVTEVGSTAIKASRRTRIVPCLPGGTLTFSPP